VHPAGRTTKRATEKLSAALENEKHLKRTLREKEVQNPEG